MERSETSARRTGPADSEARRVWRRRKKFLECSARGADAKWISLTSRAAVGRFTRDIAVVRFRGRRSLMCELVMFSLLSLRKNLSPDGKHFCPVARSRYGARFRITLHFRGGGLTPAAFGVSR
jgi:hypothetical protein